MKTITGLLRARAESRPEELAIRFREPEGWTEWTWSQYWQAARSAQATLWESGVRRGDHVLLLVPEVRPAVACLFGLWALGAVPIQIGLPFRFDNHALFFENLAETATRLDARLLIVPGSLAPIAPQSRIRALAVESIMAHEPTNGLRDPEEASGTAFIQLTSGTTSRPRGVVVPHDRLMLHMEMMSRALPSRPDSVGVSWLPLHHDMGLLGGLLFPFYNGFPGNMISTWDFQRQPWLWLQAMSRFRSTITAAPPSAYAICIPLAERLIAAGLDLSACECAMVGAEPVSAGLLRRFSAAFAPSGFRAEAFFPVYGLAEATVAVTFPRLLGPAQIDRIDRCALEREGLAARVGEDRNAQEFVGVGEPIPGAEVRIAGESGAALPERVVGEIYVRSTSLMTGYYGDSEATVNALVDGWLRTGDLGYQAGGVLFVTGRRKELIIKGGHNLIPSVLEEIASGVEGVRPGAVAAIGLRSASRESELVCIVAETRLDRADHPLLSARIRAALKAHGVAVDRVMFLPPRGLPRTTSGKIRRLAIARMLDREGVESRRRGVSTNLVIEEVAAH